MALDPRFVTGVELEQYLVDKATGAPLAGGTIWFWQDDARAVPKLVYQLTGAPPNYTYTALPNPITLSSVGTIQDAGGNNVPLYYFPYQGTPAVSTDEIELYYITVFDSFGTPQFVREGWPNIAGDENQNLTEANIANELTNPQFANVLFLTPTTIITVTGAGTMNVEIAPGWILNITATGATTVTVTQNPITGVTAYPFNPPYTLTVTPGLNITGLTLSQRLNHNPSIWSPQPGGQNGWVATSILLAPLSAVTINYAPSTGPAQQLLTSNNLTGVYAEARNTVQLTAANNTDNSNVGYVDIIIVLPPAGATTLSNVQVVGLESNETNVVYDQTPVNRQVDFMFNYFNPLLQYKPIPSWLIGWDFSLNPTQVAGAGGTVASKATGANSAYYVWDQTILFQSVTNSVAVTKATGGALRVTPNQATQFAIIQYLPAETARVMLKDQMSSLVEALIDPTNPALTVNATISMWVTQNVSLPNIGANLSVVTTLDANGYPNAVAAGWTEIPRSNRGNAQFTVTVGPTRVTSNEFNTYGFSGWDLEGAAISLSATWYAIVVGFASFGTNYIDIDSVSCCTGGIPTVPGAQSRSDVLLDCSRFYTKSFPTATVPATAAGNSDAIFFPNTVAGGAGGICQQVQFPVEMIGTPTMTFYNPVANNAFVYNNTTGASTGATSLQQAGTKSFCINYTADGGAAAGNIMSFHFTADKRLGF